MTKEQQSVLQEAQELVMGNRQADYGHPRANYESIASLFNGYLRPAGVLTKDMSPDDAAMLMLLMKVGRYATGSRKRDTIVDLAGYAEVIARIVGLDE